MAKTSLVPLRLPHKRDLDADVDHLREALPVSVGAIIDA